MFYGGKGDISGWGGDEVRDNPLDTGDLGRRLALLEGIADAVDDVIANGADCPLCRAYPHHPGCAFLAWQEYTQRAPTVDYSAQGGTVREVPGVPDVGFKIADAPDSMRYFKGDENRQRSWHILLAEVDISRPTFTGTDLVSACRIDYPKDRAIVLQSEAELEQRFDTNVQEHVCKACLKRLETLRARAQGTGAWATYALRELHEIGAVSEAQGA